MVTTISAVMSMGEAATPCGFLRTIPYKSHLFGKMAMANLWFTFVYKALDGDSGGGSVANCG